MKTKLFLMLSVLTAGLNASFVIERDAIIINRTRSNASGATLAPKTLSRPVFYGNEQGTCSKVLPARTFEQTAEAIREQNNAARAHRNIVNSLKPTTSMISANAKLNAMKCVLAGTTLAAIVATAPSEVKSTSMLSSDSQLEAVGAQGQPLVENYSKVQPTRFESFKLAMKNAYNSASDKTAKGFHYTVDTAKDHPRVAGTIAAAVVAGLGFGAYKLAKNYFGKAVAEEPKKVEDKKASNVVTPVRKTPTRKVTKRVMHRRNK